MRGWSTRSLRCRAPRSGCCRRLVQLDGTPLDVMAVMDDGVIDRPELVAAVDVATRTICAAVLRPVGAKAVDAALLLARMMVPEPMRPGWSEALALKASRIPYQRLVDIDARLSLAAAKPVIVPDTVVIDHGKVFLSEVFCQHVARYTGRDVTHRGSDVDSAGCSPRPQLRRKGDKVRAQGGISKGGSEVRAQLVPRYAARRHRGDMDRAAVYLVLGRKSPDIAAL